MNNCYEYTKATGTSNVSETTIHKTLLTTDNIHNIALYKDTLNFNENDLVTQIQMPGISAQLQQKAIQP